MIALIPGFLTGLSLIVAIGAQNAFVIRQGLLRSHVLLVVAVCSLSDAILIILGTGGLGEIVKANEELLTFIRWFGVAYLIWFGIRSLRSACKENQLLASGAAETSWKKILATVLALTYLNPHVYLDTVIFVGSIANQFTTDRWYFAFGASLASLAWFTSIGFGAQAASKLMSKPIFWRIFDTFVALIMFSIALTLALFDFSA
ncbi:COG1279 Lysine efflux permease [Candidatus Nanopelagicaceae bacterium]